MNFHPPGSDPFPPRRARRWVLPWLLLALVCTWAGGLHSVVVVVNAANPAGELSADDVSKMFLKKTARWANGERVLPVDLIDSSALRQAFSKEVHGKTTAAVKAYWQKMIFSGHDVPPPEKASIGEALAYVRNYPGAIGYAPAGADLGPGIKILKVTP
jgi:ABC-type phosphate transport system substrate-binding protein